MSVNPTPPFRNYDKLPEDKSDKADSSHDKNKKMLEQLGKIKQPAPLESNDLTKEGKVISKIQPQKSVESSTFNSPESSNVKAPQKTIDPRADVPVSERLETLKQNIFKLDDIELNIELKGREKETVELEEAQKREGAFKKFLQAEFGFLKESIENNTKLDYLEKASLRNHMNSIAERLYGKDYANNLSWHEPKKAREERFENESIPLIREKESNSYFSMVKGIVNYVSETFLSLFGKEEEFDIENDKFLLDSKIEIKPPKNKEISGQFQRPISERLEELRRDVWELDQLKQEAKNRDEEIERARKNGKDPTTINTPSDFEKQKPESRRLFLQKKYLSIKRQLDKDDKIQERNQIHGVMNVLATSLFDPSELENNQFPYQP